jgi:hypothetical protein
VEDIEFTGLPGYLAELLDEGELFKKFLGGKKIFFGIRKKFLKFFLLVISITYNKSSIK